MQRPSVKYFTIEPGNVKTIRVTMPDSNSKIIIVTVYQHTHTIIYINTNIPRPDLAMLLCKGKRRSV